MSELSTKISTILIVDDLAANRNSMAAMLEGPDAQILLAESGEQAIELYRQHRPDVILMDIVMPGVDGIEATRRIKEEAGDRFVPIIMVSSSEHEAVIRKSISAGGDDFICRPFSTEILKQKIYAIQRISKLYGEIRELNSIRNREEEVAEQLFSGAVEQGNVCLDQVKLHKQPASTFSGDVQLTARRPNGDLNVLLGDFTGHGLTSAVGAIPLAETFRAMTAKGYEAEDILKQINSKLSTLLPTGMFLAAAFVTISQDGYCSLWNGGMPDILVLSPEGDVVLRIESSDPPLGITLRLDQLIVKRVTLDAQSRILMVSDGVLEARNLEGDYFGEKRLLWAAKQGCKEEQLIKRVTRAVELFSRGHVQEDDISLIEVPAHLDLEEVPVAGAVQAPGETIEEGARWEWRIRLHGSNLKRLNPVAIGMSHLQEIEGPSDHWHDVFTILTELYVNSLDHGVLQLSSEMKASPEGFAEYFSEREQRLNAISPDSYIELQLTHIKEFDGGRLFIFIQDSGEGFPFDEWLSKEPNSNEDAQPKLSGRGITLIRELCESLHYYDDGRCAEAEFVWRS
ncbi:SpoIIE family protein phosphatase [Neptunomonas sp. XY-337]|uniref:ATP-binding SpoIIE family protein phosphatase n=1 Tax=Neptunomonas sp. XY-337 TaxID=2561897 RepID=UPI0010A9A2D4|nr:SpoIIE family protein phosphatase [Neptunomonas sp. XY-337]